MSNNNYPIYDDGPDTLITQCIYVCVHKQNTDSALRFGTADENTYSALCRTEESSSEFSEPVQCQQPSKPGAFFSAPAQILCRPSSPVPSSVRLCVLWTDSKKYTHDSIDQYRFRVYKNTTIISSLEVFNVENFSARYDDSRQLVRCVYQQHGCPRLYCVYVLFIEAWVGLSDLHI